MLRSKLIYEDMPPPSNYKKALTGARQAPTSNAAVAIGNILPAAPHQSASAGTFPQRAVCKAQEQHNLHEESEAKEQARPAGRRPGRRCARPRLRVQELRVRARVRAQAAPAAT